VILSPVTFMPDLHGGRRLSIRLPNHDYSGNAAYLITLCTHRRAHLFGTVVDNTVELSPIGQLVQDLWVRTPVVRPGVSLDAFVVMPDHMHATVLIPEFGQRLRQTFPRPPRSLGSLIAGFKSVCTSQVRALTGTTELRVWQRNYHERWIRDATALDRIRRYIAANPARWVHTSASKNTVTDIAELKGARCAPLQDSRAAPGGHHG
jgi:REP element-mobilizing transposase RayT